MTLDQKPKFTLGNDEYINLNIIKITYYNFTKGRIKTMVIVLPRKKKKRFEFFYVFTQGKMIVSLGVSYCPSILLPKSLFRR